MRTNTQPLDTTPANSNGPVAIAPAGVSPAAPELTLSNGITLAALRPLKVLPGAFAMPFADYLKHPALGRSTLDKIRKSPLNLQHYLQHGEPDTPAFLRGRVAHRLLLEPKEFWLATVAWPAEYDASLDAGGSKTTGEGSKKRWEAFQRKHAGKDIISAEEKLLLEELEELFKSHPLTKSLLVGAATEATVFFEHDGIKCKARADVVQGDVIYDVKTTRDLAAFEKNVYTYGYHRQAAWYLDGFRAGTGKAFNTFRLVAVEWPEKAEKKGPIDIAVYELDPDVVEDGRDENRENLARYKRCLTTGNWPGFAPVAPLRVSRPAWRVQQ